MGEAWRILVPGGRLVLVERQAKPGARGHAAHGLTRGQAGDLTRQLTDVGFGQVRLTAVKAGRKSVVIIRGAKA